MQKSQFQITLYKFASSFLFLLLLLFSCVSKDKDKDKKIFTPLSRASKDHINEKDSINKGVFTDAKQSLTPFSSKPFLIGLKIKEPIVEIKSIKLRVLENFIGYSVYTVVNKPSFLQELKRACKSISKETFYNSGKMPLEENISNATNFFWALKDLEDISVFRNVSDTAWQYIIIDNNSDTIYHRIEMLN